MKGIITMCAYQKAVEKAQKNVVIIDGSKHLGHKSLL